MLKLYGLGREGGKQKQWEDIRLIQCIMTYDYDVNKTLTQFIQKKKNTNTMVLFILIIKSSTGEALVVQAQAHKYNKITNPY